MSSINDISQPQVIYDITRSEGNYSNVYYELQKLCLRKSKTISVKLPKTIDALSWLSNVLTADYSIIGALILTNDFPENNIESCEELSILTNLVESKEKSILVIVNAHDLFAYPRACCAIQECLEKGLQTIFIHTEQTMH